MLYKAVLIYIRARHHMLGEGYFLHWFNKFHKTCATENVVIWTKSDPANSIEYYNTCSIEYYKSVAPNSI